MSRPALSSEFITLDAAAERLGFSVRTMRKKISTGELPAYRLSHQPGSAIRVKITDVDALMQPLIPPGVYAERAARQRHPLHQVD